MNIQGTLVGGSGVRKRMTAMRHGLVVAALVLFGGGASAQTVERVSIRPDGAQGNARSSGPDTDATGTCVAFWSDASNLLPLGADSNGVRDVFLFDRATDQLQRVSVSSTGEQGNRASQSEGFLPSVADDCSCVAFSSDATNLVPDDANQTTDIFVRDLLAAATERVSISSDGSGANGPSVFPSVDADCDRVAFHSKASNLVPDDTNGVTDVFVFDRDTGETIRFSTGAGGEEADGRSITPSISADGRCVAFASAATNLLGPDNNRRLDIYVACDGVVTCRASVSTSGVEANGDSFLPSLNADGRIVAFKSLASNLVPGDTNGAADVFVHDCDKGTTERVSVNSRGEQGNDHSFPGTISGDGRFVAFGSFATNMAVGKGTNGQAQIYVRDREQMITVMVSVSPSGQAGNGSPPDMPPSISRNGAFVAFASLASNLVPGDTNEVMDAFIAENVLGPVIPCVVDEDCPEGQECVDGVCRPIVTETPTPTITGTPPTATPTSTRTPTPEIDCFFDLDCPENHVCIDGICRVVVCETDEDCTEGRICEDGLCQSIPLTPTPLPTCISDEDCPEPDRCRAGVCVPPRVCDDEDAVVDRLNCRGVRETCVGGTCECGGDCNFDGIVFGNEISVALNILGGATPLSECPAADIIFPPDEQVMGNEITLAVLNLGFGCPGEGLPLELFEDRSDEIRTLEIGSTSGAPGQTVDVPISISGGGEVATAQMDLLFDSDVLRLVDPDEPCTVSARLQATHTLGAFLPQRPATPPGVQRLRLFVGDVAFPVEEFDEGPIATCRFEIVAGASPGTVALTGERLNIGDPAGNVFGASVVPGSVTVTEGECVPQNCPAFPRQTCVGGSCACTGDCNGDGSVFGNEITIAVLILGGEADLSQCLAADADGDGEVFSNEVTLAVINLGEGCPSGEE